MQIEDYLYQKDLYLPLGGLAVVRSLCRLLLKQTTSCKAKVRYWSVLLPVLAFYGLKSEDCRFGRDVLMISLDPCFCNGWSAMCRILNAGSFVIFPLVLLLVYCVSKLRIIRHGFSAELCDMISGLRMLVSEGMSEVVSVPLWAASEMLPWISPTELLMNWHVSFIVLPEDVAMPCLNM